MCIDGGVLEKFNSRVNIETISHLFFVCFMHSNNMYFKFVECVYYYKLKAGLDIVLYATLQFLYNCYTRFAGQEYT